MEEEDDQTSQKEEIEALVSIYDDCINLLPSTSGRSFEIKLENATLRLNFPSDYPSKSAPSYELSAPFLQRGEKEQLQKQLQVILSNNVGMPVTFSLVECMKDFLQQFQSESELQEDKNPKNPAQIEEALSHLSMIQCPEITTGDCIEDRKSVFQGHFAQVQSLEEVKAVLSKLNENRKIAHATHNMFAYRIKQPGDGKMFLQDCDDDGETNAGTRMLHLLQILECQNVLVVVSRWYGGIQLGPDRFKHINNAARNVLEIAGVLESKAQTGPKKNRSGKKKV